MSAQPSRRRRRNSTRVESECAQHKISDCDIPAMSRLGFCEGMLNAVRVSASGEHPFWPEALSDDSIEFIEKHIEAILVELHAGSPAETATAAILERFARP